MTASWNAISVILKWLVVQPNKRTSRWPQAGDAVAECDLESLVTIHTEVPIPGVSALVAQAKIAISDRRSDAAGTQEIGFW